MSELRSRVMGHAERATRAMILQDIGDIRPGKLYLVTYVDIILLYIQGEHHEGPFKIAYSSPSSKEKHIVCPTHLSVSQAHNAYLCSMAHLQLLPTFLSWTMISNFESTTPLFFFDSAVTLLNRKGVSPVPVCQRRWWFPSQFYIIKADRSFFADIGVAAKNRAVCYFYK